MPKPCAARSLRSPQVSGSSPFRLAQRLDQKREPIPVVAQELASAGDTNAAFRISPVRDAYATSTWGVLPLQKDRVGDLLRSTGRSFRPRRTSGRRRAALRSGKPLTPQSTLDAIHSDVPLRPSHRRGVHHHLAHVGASTIHHARKRTSNALTGKLSGTKAKKVAVKRAKA